MSTELARAEKINQFLASQMDEFSRPGVRAELNYLAQKLANIFGPDKWSSWGMELQDGTSLADALADLVGSQVFIGIVTQELARRIVARGWDLRVLEAEVSDAPVGVYDSFNEGLVKGLAAKKGISAKRAEETKDEAMLLGMVIGEHLACSGKPLYNPVTPAVREACRRRFETGIKTGKWPSVTSPAELIADLNLKRFKRRQPGSTEHARHW